MKQHEGDLLKGYIFLYHPQVIILILHLSTNPFNPNLTNIFGLLDARAWIARSLLEKDGLFNLSEEEMNIICNSTDGMDNFPVNHSIFLPFHGFCDLFLLGNFLFRLFRIRHEKLSEGRFNWSFERGNKSR